MDPEDTVQYVAGGAELLDAVAPLWEKLHRHHVSKSPHFSEVLAAYSFAERKKRLLSVAAEGLLHINLAKNSSSGDCVGYCISSIASGGVGEIESLFVDEAYRGVHIGDALVKQAIAWMDSLNVKSKVVYVGYGNEESFSFYARYGFYPYNVMLKQRDA